MVLLKVKMMILVQKLQCILLHQILYQSKEEIDKKIVDKELEIIKAEIKNSGKPPEMAEKISKGKITKFLNENSLLNQIWIMDPKKVSDILKEKSLDKEIKILEFVKYKVGEGV